MEEVFKELLLYFTNYISDSESSESDLFFYLSEDDNI
jgi:hypothetical protein